MSKRAILAICIATLIVAGLSAGVFANSIERALTLPVIQKKTARVLTIRPTMLVTPTSAPPTQLPSNILAQDTFHRADQSLWGMASDGRIWGSDANTQHNFSIVGTAGRIANGQGAYDAVLGPVSSNVEVVMNASLNHFVGTTVNLGVVVRWNDPNNWYKVFIDGTHLVMLKHVNGVPTQLQSTLFKAQGGVMYTIRFRAVGATLFARVWPSNTVEPAHWMITVTDTSFTSGQVGVRVLVQPETVVNVNSFFATTASSTM